MADENTKKLSEMTEEEIAADIEKRATEKAAEKVAAETAAKQKELDEAKAELEKLQKKDFDFSKMKDGEKALLDKIEGLEKGLKERDTKAITDRKASLVKAITGNDEAMKKNLEDSYAKLSAMPETTPEEVEARMREAFTLATGQKQTEDGFKSRISSARTSRANTAAPEGALAPEVKPLANRLGISDEDWKKHGGKKPSSAESNY